MVAAGLECECRLFQSGFSSIPQPQRTTKVRSKLQTNRVLTRRRARQNSGSLGCDPLHEDRLEAIRETYIPCPSKTLSAFNTNKHRALSFTANCVSSGTW